MQRIFVVVFAFALAACAAEPPRALPLCADLGCPSVSSLFCNRMGVCDCNGEQCRIVHADAGAGDVDDGDDGTTDATGTSASATPYDLCSDVDASDHD